VGLIGLLAAANAFWSAAEAFASTPWMPCCAADRFRGSRSRLRRALIQLINLVDYRPSCCLT